MLAEEGNNFKYDVLHLSSPERAMKMVQDNLLGVLVGPEMTFDALVWGKIFEYALQSGTDFLGVNTDNPVVWHLLLKCGIGWETHSCFLMNCHGQRNKDLHTFFLGPEEFLLFIDHYDHVEENGQSSKLTTILDKNMRSSFVRWLLHVGFPSFSRSNDNYTQDLPDDILLLLAMLQAPDVQLTSSTHKSTSLVESMEGLFARVLHQVNDYVHDIQFNADPNHKDVDRATLYALRSVVQSQSFGTGVLSPEHEATILYDLFSGLNRRCVFSEPGDHDPTWLTPSLFHKIWNVASGLTKRADIRKGCATTAHIFAYVTRFATHAYAVETIYTHLVEVDWLHEIGEQFTRFVQLGDGLPDCWCPGYNYMAVTFIDGLSSSSQAANCGECFERARAYIARPEALAAICKILLLSDDDTQDKLWRLTVLVRGEVWEDCLHELCGLLSCEKSEEVYDLKAYLTLSKNINRLKNYFRPFSILPTLVTILSADITHRQFTPPLLGRPEREADYFHLTGSPAHNEPNPWLKFTEYCKRLFCGRAGSAIAGSSYSMSSKGTVTLSP